MVANNNSNSNASNSSTTASSSAAPAATTASASSAKKPAATTSTTTPQPPPPPSTGNSISSSNSSSSQLLLAERFPVNTLWELTLVTKETLVGHVYCTDEAAQAVVLVVVGTGSAQEKGASAAAATSLHSNVRIVNAKFITTAIPVAMDNETGKAKQQQSSAALPPPLPPLSQPLAKVNKKQLEEREKRAIRQAEECFRHINLKATPEGQACFDRLLKACNEVVWIGESILVLNQIQVDPPYTRESCRIVKQQPQPQLSLPSASGPGGASSSSSTTSQPSRGGATASSSSLAAAAAKRQTALDDSSLDRVRKIVAAGDNSNNKAASATATAAEASVPDSAKPL